MTGVRGSLKWRLLLGAAVWVTAALVIAGLIQSELFSRYVRERFRVSLEHALDQLAASLDVNAAGMVAVAAPMSDPRFGRPFSGMYWQVASGGQVILTSRSLWDQTLALPVDTLGDGEVHDHEMIGPRDRPLLVLERLLWVPERATPLRIAVAEDTSGLKAALASYRGVLAQALAILALSLFAAAFVQVTLGLRPLVWLRNELGEIRAGRRRRFTRPMPREVQPLIDDLNALLAHADEVVERARLQAGNMAHGLKTNLAVLANEVDHVSNATDRASAEASLHVMRAQIEAMRRHLDHHMARARAAASRGLPGMAADVAAAATGLIRVMEKVHLSRRLKVRSDIPAGLKFAGDRQDLEEMLGNLLDNACKWARQTVIVTAIREGHDLAVAVEDDGPGLAAEQREAALAPGGRLDEKVPGSGLGLAVVADLVRLYGGTLELGESPLGGLRAVLHLPAAA
jgi:signal transduction histidine kinase